MREELIYLMMHLENGKSKTKTQVSDTKACVFNSLFLCTQICKEEVRYLRFVLKKDTRFHTLVGSYILMALA